DERRVSLTAMLIMSYGIGACIGPLAACVVINLFGGHMLYGFVCGAGVILVLLSRPKAVTHLHQVENAPLHHGAMPDS
ncbi:MFS transporter, partial [Pseudomonas syringae pv. tagetis]